MQVQRLNEVLLQLHVPMRAPLPQRVPNLVRRLVILPRQRQVEPKGRAIHPLSHREILAKAAQQAGLACAFVACNCDEAWRESFLHRVPDHARTLALATRLGA